MKISKAASAGTLESSDVLVEVQPAKGTLDVQIDSVVSEQYGMAIRSTVLEVLQSLNVTEASVRLSDRGALDCVIRARVETALRRGSEGTT